MISHIDLERVVSAGVIDRQFRELLLRDPLRAAEGYRSERFQLTSEEKAVLLRARTIAHGKASPAGNDYSTFVNEIARWIDDRRSWTAANV